MANSARPTQWGVGSGRSSGIPSLPRVGWRGCFQPARAFAWSGLEIFCSFPPLCGVGWDFGGPRTLKRRVAALGRGVAREHDGYTAGAFSW